MEAFFPLEIPILQMSRECKIPISHPSPLFFSENIKWISCFSIRSMLLRDLQSVVLYDPEGKFAGVRRPNSKLPIEIDGTKIEIVDAIGSSGLDMKVMLQLYLHNYQLFTVS